jgi:Tfp pilus assembly protein PilN
MINLLPPDLKEAYRYAHRNVVLVRWVVAFGVGLVLFAGISTGGLIYLKQIDNGYANDIASKHTSLKQQDEAGVEKQVKDISGSLKLAVQVLSKEVLFSKLLGQLATVTPNNAVLTDLTIAQDESAINITAHTTDYNAATQLQTNITDPANKIFSKADIINIACGQSDPQYPCEVTIRALFSSDNPFLFINGGGNS